MRIGFDARILAHPYSGIACYLLNLVKEFQKKAVGEIILFSDKPIREEYKILVPEIPQVIFGDRHRKRWGRWSLPFQLSKHRVDLYHAIWNLGVPLWSPCPVVLTVYDLFPLLFPETFTRARKRFRYRWNLLLDVWRADRVITISETSKRDLEKCLRLAAEKICVIPYGIELEKINAIDAGHIAKWREHFGLKKQYLISALGRIAEKRKNCARLLQAFQKVKIEYPEIKLVILGSGTAEGVESEPAICILEGLPREAVLSLMKGAILLVHATLYDGFGLPPLEAMACGTPVVSGEVGAIPEVVGDAALFIDPTNVDDLAAGMRRLMQDESLRSRYIRLGKDRSTQYNWERAANETLQVYSQLIRSK